MPLLTLQAWVLPQTIGKVIFSLGVVGIITLLALTLMACSHQDPEVVAQRLVDSNLSAFAKLERLFDLAIDQGKKGQSEACANAYSTYLNGNIELFDEFKQTPEGEAYWDIFDGIPLDDERKLPLMVEYVSEQDHEVLESYIQRRIALLDAGISACS